VHLSYVVLVDYYYLFLSFVLDVLLLLLFVIIFIQDIYSNTCKKHFAGNIMLQLFCDNLLYV